jgi:hypothetical protein
VSGASPRGRTPFGPTGLVATLSRCVNVNVVYLFSLTVRRARSKNLAWHSSPSVPRRWLTALAVGARRRLAPGPNAVRPYVFEIVTGGTGAQMQSPGAAGSGRKTQAVR